MVEKKERLDIKKLKWIKSVTKEARNKNLIPLFIKQEDGKTTCLMYHQGNGFLLGIKHFRDNEEGEK